MSHSFYLLLCIWMLQGSEESMPVWYILDEFGARIQHSDEPNIKMAPFVYAVNNTTYSIFWPIKDLNCDGKFTDEG